MSLADIQAMKALKLAKQSVSAAIGNSVNTANQITLNLGIPKTTPTNLYNSATSITGKYIDWTNGQLANNSSYLASDYIPVKAQTAYTRVNNLHIAFYDSNKSFLSANQNSGVYFTTPANCAYIRVDMLTTSPTENIQEVFPSSTITAMIPFQFGKNLYNPATSISGKYVNWTNGMLNDNSYYVTSDWFPVTPYTIYVSNTQIQYLAFYDANKNFLSGSSTGLTNIVTPNNCYFIRLSISNTATNVQIEEGSASTTYQPYQLITNHNTLSTFHDLRLSIPDVIYVVVGHEMNIYKTNMICVDNINNYQVTFTCNVGQHQNERWTYTPVSGDVGNYTMTINIYQKFNLIATVATTIQVLPASKTGSFKTLIIGDSTTANNTMINKLASVLTGDPLTITFEGTQGTAPNMHEGRSGWYTSKFYSDATSPFVFNGSFNFSQYLSTNSITAPDIVVINLGINDMFSYTDDQSTLNAIYTMISQYDAMITNIKQANANVKIGIAVTVPSGNQDAFGSGYGAGQPSWRYNRNNRILTKALCDYYRGKQSSNIYLLPLNLNLDTVNNIDTSASAPVNAQNTAVSVARQTNGVHPGTYGYYQIADTYYHWLKSFGA